MVIALSVFVASCFVHIGSLINRNNLHQAKSNKAKDTKIIDHFVYALVNKAIRQKPSQYRVYEFKSSSISIYIYFPTPQTTCEIKKRSPAAQHSISAHSRYVHVAKKIESPPQQPTVGHSLCASINNRLPIHFISFTKCYYFSPFHHSKKR